MVRNRKYVLFTSLILTIVVFLGGLALGWSMDHLKLGDVLDEIKTGEVVTESFITEQAFIDRYSSESCELLTDRIYNLQKVMANIGSQLGKWGEVGIFQAKDYDYLKRKYVVLEVRFLMLLQEFNEECEANYDYILFFYEIDQKDSILQGQILDAVVFDQEDLVVLAIDKDFTSEPLVELLVSYYEIEDAPTLIINDRIKLEEVVSKDDLITALEHFL